METQELKQRTQLFALRIIKLTSALPKNVIGHAISNQIIRSGTSVGANYRAACRAKSSADFINKIRIVEEEADETLYWLELIELAELIKKSQLKSLIDEADQLTAIFTSIGKTTKQNIRDLKS